MRDASSAPEKDVFAIKNTVRIIPRGEFCDEGFKRPKFAESKKRVGATLSGRKNDVPAIQNNVWLNLRRKFRDEGFRRSKFAESKNGLPRRFQGAENHKYRINKHAVEISR